MIDNQLFINSFSSLFMVAWVALNTVIKSSIADIGDAFRNDDSCHIRYISTIEGIVLTE